MPVIEEKLVVTPDGAEIAYEVREERPGLLPILALHGVLVGTSNWVHQMLRLPQFHWIAPSFRGHGRSAPPGSPPEIEQAALDALAVLDAEAVEQAVVLGNSLGATVGLALGLLRPERVLALVLAEPSIPQLLSDHAGERLTKQAARAQQFLDAGEIDAALDIFLTPRIGADWRNKVGRRRLAEWRHNVLATPAWFEAVNAFNPGPGPLAALDIPTLIVYGAETQRTYRQLTEAVAEALPGARLAVVPDAGHGSPADNPEAFNALLLDFLRGLGLA
ncbi:MAG TPA: alpha/beta fold hydrolase [Thermomicrobiaceae bacterium]|nr:alpha/beta fold hydrolase [Thermomicrobiaceae bacterium]